LRHHSIEAGIESIYHSKKNKTKAIRRWVRILLIIAGTFFAGAGILGIFIPVLPTTPFLLLAAACYARSSQRFYDWLLNNRWFGNYIRNYLQGKGVPLKVKVLTLALLWITIGCSVAFAVQLFIVRLILMLIAIGVSIHVLSLRTLKE
jgi:uncharacterized membrane protein YbaN (DUF454 family)